MVNSLYTHAPRRCSTALHRKRGRQPQLPPSTTRLASEMHVNARTALRYKGELGNGTTAIQRQHMPLIPRWPLPSSWSTATPRHGLPHKQLGRTPAFLPLLDRAPSLTPAMRRDPHAAGVSEGSWGDRPDTGRPGGRTSANTPCPLKIGRSPSTPLECSAAASILLLAADW